MSVIGWRSVAWPVVVAAGVLVGQAQAHLISGGTGTVQIRDDDAIVLIAVPAQVLPGLPRDKDGHIAAQAIDAKRAAILEFLRKRFRLAVDGRRAAVAEDMLLSPDGSRAHDHARQVSWWARLTWGQGKSLARSKVKDGCIELGIDWQFEGDETRVGQDYVVVVQRAGVRETGVFTRGQPDRQFFCEK